MNLLLDTHAFIWWNDEPEKLSATALALCQDRANRLFLSVASIWEIQIKSQIGKLSLQMPLGEMIESQERINGVEGVPITLAHVMALDELPAHHRDPFDRLLIAQARVEHAVLLSNDRVFSAYSVDVTW